LVTPAIPGSVLFRSLSPPLPLFPHHNLIHPSPSIHNRHINPPRKKKKMSLQEEQSSTNYKEAFSLFDKRGTGKVALESLGDLLRACGQNPTLAEISELEKSIGGDCMPPVSRSRLYQFVWMMLILAGGGSRLRCVLESAESPQWFPRPWRAGGILSGFPGV
jgi:hypothetical protein